MINSISKIIFVIAILAGNSYASEAELNEKFCLSINGKTETRHYYNNKQGYIKIDCETKNKVYEMGLDKRSSLDSIQQAVFASYLTGKTAVVVIYNTDNKHGKYEYRIQKAAEELDIKYITTQP